MEAAEECTVLRSVGYRRHDYRSMDGARTEASPDPFFNLCSEASTRLGRRYVTVCAPDKAVDREGPNHEGRQCHRIGACRERDEKGGERSVARGKGDCLV